MAITDADPFTREAITELERCGLLRDRGLIGGEWVAADGGETYPVTDPATGALLAEMARMGATETRAAIEAARDALSGWRATPAAARAKILRRWCELVLEQQEQLALLMTLEQGKPLAEARGEIAYSASFLEWFAEEGKRVYGDTIPSANPDNRIVVLKQPIGVTAGITPWNFPAAMPARKAAPALAAGCTMVLKPAEQTPLSTLAIAELAIRAGLPAGVLNVVTGDGPDAPEIGAELTGNPIVRKLSFTGSTEIGKLLMRQCADTVKKVSLELGGNAPFIVFDDADLNAAAAGAIVAKFRNSGQVCVAANRILVHEAVADEFARRLSEAAAALVVGSGVAPGSQVGPLIDRPALEKVVRHVADARDGGARLLLGGEPHELGGTFYEPTVLLGTTGEMLMSNEETFGPVAGIQTFADEDEALTIANDTPMGLSGYFYSRDIGRVWRVAEALETGIVGVNTGLISTEVAPFGGIKESGIGREGSRYGIDDWLEIKYVCLGGIGA
ncbi:MAG: NAD-dependent succinate-semialdehyde dehydrogenase [Solirubrobacteraceae bacterium]